jgi:hypothetical protein
MRHIETSATALFAKPPQPIPLPFDRFHKTEADGDLAIGAGRSPDGYKSAVRLPGAFDKFGRLYRCLPETSRPIARWLQADFTRSG